MSLKKKDLTVVICTYNRKECLRRAINSVLGSIDLLLEIIIIDNDSTDGTYDFVKETFLQNPKIRYVLEQKKGIAHVRNRGIQEVKSDYFLFLDDDAWASNHWIKRMNSLIDKGITKIVCATGPVSLVWEGKGKPSWFPEKYESLLCEYNMGKDSKFLSSSGYLLTTNVLFKKSTLEKLGGFRTDLGRVGGKTLGGEDNDIFQRFYQNGYQVWYQSDALVFHPVPIKRQTKKYLFERVYWDGVSQQLLNNIRSEKRSLILRKISYEIRKIIQLFVFGIKSQNEFETRLAIQHRKGRLKSYFIALLNKETNN